MDLEYWGAYMTKMLEPAMRRPCPKPTHEYVDGAEIWKKISPLPELAVVSGMFNE